MHPHTAVATRKLSLHLPHPLGIILHSIMDHWWYYNTRYPSSLLLQFVSVGSGFHSPFPVQIDVLDPVSSNPGGQLKEINAPSTAGL